MEPGAGAGADAGASTGAGPGASDNALVQRLLQNIALPDGSNAAARGWQASLRRTGRGAQLIVEVPPELGGSLEAWREGLERALSRALATEAPGTAQGSAGSTEGSAEGSTGGAQEREEARASVILTAERASGAPLAAGGGSASPGSLPPRRWHPPPPGRAQPAHRPAMKTARRSHRGVRRIVAIGSGKGGVGQIHRSGEPRRRPSPTAAGGRACWTLTSTAPRRR